MNKEKILSTFLFILFLTFIGIYVTNATGYNEYEMHKKTELTKEQIERFEEDIKENKNIDINDYVNANVSNYSNGFSKASLSFSNFTGKYIKQGINGVLNFINTMLS